MNIDPGLKKKVLAELDWDPAIHAAAIAVSVQDGIITVAGDVRTFAEKEAVAAAVRRVAGVRALALELEVTRNNLLVEPRTKARSQFVVLGIEQFALHRDSLPQRRLCPLR